MEAWVSDWGKMMSDSWGSGIMGEAKLAGWMTKVVVVVMVIGLKVGASWDYELSPWFAWWVLYLHGSRPKV